MEGTNMLCPKCQFENPDENKFCRECGSKLRLECPVCASEILSSDKFCGECGHALKESTQTPAVDYSKPQSYTPKFLADKILTNRSALEGERKLVTVLFADVANYTAMSEALDPEEVHQIMDGCFKILMDEIHNYEGTINQFTGDGVMALFGAPLAHEDHAQRACYASLSIQKDVEAYEEKIKTKYGVNFKMRIGLNSGPVVVGAIGDDLRMDYTAVGDTTNLAARIQQAAKSSEVWMSADTRDIVRDYFQDLPIGEISLKGKSQPQRVYRLFTNQRVRTRFEASLLRGMTELVGRGLELDALQTAFERAKGGEAQVLDIVGEAGVGKSRLMYEFNRDLSDDLLFLTGFSVHYGRNINFLPVIDVVREALEISEGMPEEDVARLIEEKAIDGLTSGVPFYRNLLSLEVDDPKFGSLDPEGRKFGTFEAVKDLLLAQSAKRPLIIFLEDAHWMDKISEEFFTYFSRSFFRYPVLMIAAYRPEGAPSWSFGAHYQRLGLETLSSNASIRLMRNVLGGIVLDPRLEKSLLERTGGNPFFVEEIVRELLDRRDLVKKGNEYISNQPIDQLKIPNTIQGVLAARMDRLSEDHKRTMQVAAVIGRDFVYSLLRSIMELGDEIRAHLTNLVGLEILYEKALYPELEYIFKHALTQEVAYESLLKQRRKELHSRIAQTIEEIHADQLEKHYELLAYHYERSENKVKAIDYLILAGEKSNKNSATQAAIEFFDKAYEIAESKNITLNVESKIRLHQGRAMASYEIGAFGKSVEDHRKAISISRQNGLLNYEKENLLRLSFMMHLWPMKAEAERTLEETIVRAREIGDKAFESSILCHIGSCTAVNGQPYKGNQINVEAESMAKESGDNRSQFLTKLHRSFTERWIGRPEKTIELTEGLSEIAIDVFSVSVLSYVVSFRGVALAEVGRIAEAAAIIKTGIDICEKFGASMRLGCLYNCLGYCYGEIHQVELALGFNRKGEEIARQLMEKYPMGIRQYAEMVAQSRVNILENLFDQRNFDEAWGQFESFKEETKGEDFGLMRHQWESRLNYLAAKILLQRNSIGQAETIILKNLEATHKNHMRKKEGGFLRLLGELQIIRNEFDNAITTLNKAIQILKEVGNRRLIWEAYSSLASAFNKLDRSSEATENWGLAAELINDVANGLTDLKLRSGFIGAQPIKEILFNSGA
jgi:class 3 adenylate cyclase